MASERVVPLDQDTLDLFAFKGAPRGCDAPQVGNSNGLKVRRVMQLIRDLSKKPFDQLQILDLACGEGVYAIEAALRGAEVRALDARTERMNEGARAAERLGLKNLHFEQADVRHVTVASHGEVDVTLFLGILYHLDQRDIFPVLKNIYEMCRQFAIIDTHVALQGLVKIEYEGRVYEGRQVREHGEDDPEEVRKGRLKASLDNPWSFRFTEQSLFRLLRDIGFTTVCECHVPSEPHKPSDRITVVAVKGEPVQLSSYPWVNGAPEDELELLVGRYVSQVSGRAPGAPRPGARQLARSVVNGALRAVGLEIRRI